MFTIKTNLMISINIFIFLFVVAVAKNQAYLHHKSFLISHLKDVLRSKDNFFSELTKNAQKVVNGIFLSLHLSEVFSKEPKIKAILNMVYNLDNMTQKNFEFYNVLRNATAVLDNKPINHIRLNDLIIEIINEEEVNIYNKTEHKISENSHGIPSSEHSEFADSKEFKEFIGHFIRKLRSLSVHDLFDNKTSIENSEDESNQFSRRNLEVWEPSAEEVNISSVKSRRIFRGKRTNIISFPFVVSIHILNDFVCAGSIISKDLIITAASCLQLHHNNRFFRENPLTTHVRVGSNWTTRRGERIPVQEIYFHPLYDPKSLNHNLAIVRLARNLHFQKRNNTKIRRILLDRGDGNLAANIAEIKLLGWGAKRRDQVVYEFEKLNIAILGIYLIADCREVYSKEFVTINHFCAGYVAKGSGACNRDVGGPGVIGNFLVGVVSFGPPVCGAPDSPTVFTRVGHYIDWIESVMALRPIVYGVQTTSTQADKFLIYFNTPSPYTNPTMIPILVTKSVNESALSEYKKPAVNEMIRTNGMQYDSDERVLREIVNDMRNNNDNIINDVIHHDLYNDFENMPKPGDKESINEQNFGAMMHA